MSHEVFISYSSLDKDTADQLCAALEDSGTACWIAPRDVMPGKPYGEALIDAINDSHIMVLVLSEHSNHSRQVMREVERAASKGIPIIPLRIADVQLAKSLEYFLSTCHWLDATNGDVQGQLPRLTEAVNEMLRQFYDGETLRLGPVAAPAKARKGRSKPGSSAPLDEAKEIGSIYTAELVSTQPPVTPATHDHSPPYRAAHANTAQPRPQYQPPPRYQRTPPRTSPPATAGNALGVAGLTASVLGLFTCGTLSPIGLILSLFGLLKAPRGYATAGSAVGAFGSMIFLVLFGYGFYGGFMTALALEDAAAEIDSYYYATGELPDDFTGDELIAQERDAWNHPCRYTRSWMGYEIRSAGLDGEFDTSDDQTLVR